MGIFRCFSCHVQTTSPDPSVPTTPSRRSRQLAMVFDKFDSNGDGKISSSELAASFHSLGQPLTEEELRRMMAEADTDGDGFISLEEFLELNTKRVDSPAQLEDLRRAFSVYDIDRSGKISAEELAEVLGCLGENASMAQCRKMIHGVDEDGDGQVDFEEFKRMMMVPRPPPASSSSAAKGSEVVRLSDPKRKH